MIETEIEKRLLSGPPCRAADADLRVPQDPGYYAIFVDDQAVLPNPYHSSLARQRIPRLTYIGIAKRSLRKRLVEQDLRHRSASTFFRGLGCILGHKPPAGSLVGKANKNNYKFSEKDTAEIIAWINRHLLVRWVEADPALEPIEAALIEKHAPLLNTKHNPSPVKELAALRHECGQIAQARSGTAKAMP